MKKRIIALLLLAITMLSVLAGCAKAQDPISEQDTDSRTLTHVIGKYQKITYSFHMKKIDENSGAGLNVFLLSDDVEDPLDANNYCSVNIGFSGYSAFKAHHHSGLDYSHRWITEKNPSEWKMDEPYTSMEEINEADVTITYIRNGKSLRVLADIDGERAWQGDGGIKHMRDKEVYVYLTSANYALTNVQYHDMGYTFVMPPVVYVILIILGIIAIFVIHTIAKIGEKKLYYVDAPIFCSLLSAGFTICVIGLVIMLIGRTHPELLNKMFFGYITVTMPFDGAGFWVPAVIFAVGAIGLGIAIANLAIGVDNVPLRLLCAFGLGILHTLWYYTVANIIIQSIDEIFAIIAIIIFVLIIGAISDNTVVKSYHLYGRNGYIGSVYTLVGKDEAKKKK